MSRYSKYSILLLLNFYQIYICARPIDANPPKTVWLNVFVHGIVSLRAHLSFENFGNFFKDRIVNTDYEHATEFARKDPYFFQQHAIQQPGLKKINLQGVSRGKAAALFASIYDQLLEYDPQTTQQRYYTYGWSGLLSRKMRYHEAELFYLNLLKEVESLESQNCTVKIRILAYSHGAVLSLKLAAVEQRKPLTKYLFVDELIMVGMPVLPESHELIRHKMFGTIWHIYSFWDRVQTFDFASAARFISDRYYYPTKIFRPKHNLYQIDLRLSEPRKLIKNPHSKRQIRNMSPGHTEFWSFGWVPSNYRRHFPLYPLPVAVITPIIQQRITQLCLPNKNHVIFDIHTYSSTVYIADQCKRDWDETRFIDRKKLEQLKNYACAYQPTNFSYDEYEEHIAESITRARERKKYLATLLPPPTRPERKHYKKIKCRKKRYQCCSIT